MPDALLSAWATPGLFWLLLTIGAAGLVRGFTGFGTALIFVPVAGIFLTPVEVILMIVLTGVASTAALLPGAWGQADRKEVGTLALAATVTVPLGIWIMGQVDELLLRWFIAVIVGGTLLAVVSGWRYQGRLGLKGRGAIGSSAGLIGGMTGLTGPVVIVFYLANARDITKVRANTIVFLTAMDIVIALNLLVRGNVTSEAIWLAVLLSVPYFTTTMIGKAIFDPRFERAYRVAAYSVIAIAVISSLPIFD
ncbi:sulfite exporter TauE/SafE family protein [Epibacterium ulvae]|uniref:sulfite exporter TauE/SafE family protein n=1 Tax=Epibacterium ulvae TaxID=1156985 RepID=UPI0024905E89|nr:sulfite exporter TauE/SafE family protein [Epibacterium ulvae]